MKELEKSLDYKFNTPAILRNALTHSSFVNECGKSSAVCNERLEFLGDAILEATVSDYIYKHYPELGEGKMSQIRSVVVCENGLYAFAMEIDLGKYILMSNGEAAGGGRKKPSILSDAVEALIAAIYLDADFEAAKSFVIKHLEKYIISAVENNKSDGDYKSRLQELALSKGHTIQYELIDQTGPDHQKVFTAQAIYNELSTKGTGTSKKKAQQQAAKAMLELLK